MRVVIATLRRDLRVGATYRTNAVLTLAGIFGSLVTFSFVARLVPSAQSALRPYAADYFSFVLVGLAATTLFTVAAGGFSRVLEREQSSGTLEVLLLSPHDARLVLAAGAAWPIVSALVEVVILVVVGVVVLHAHLIWHGVLVAMLILLLIVVIFGGIGLCAVAVLLQTKRGSGVIGALTLAVSIAGGVLYPVSVLPGWLQAMARLVPLSWGLDGLRRSLGPHPDPGVLGLDVLVLCLFAVVVIPGGTVALGWSIDRARRQGSLGQY